MRIRIALALALTLSAAHSSIAQAEISSTSRSAALMSLADASDHAVSLSKLILPGSAPFHLKAKIVETTNPNSSYKADIEEYWVSADKFRRTIQTPGLSQTLIVNGDNTYEQDTGDYSPWWLNDLLTAMFDPLPMLDEVKHVSATIAKPSGKPHSASCSRLQTDVGYFVFCFEGVRGALESVTTPGYDADFKDYKDFEDKYIARQIVIDPEPGTTLECRITELSEYTNADEGLFAVPQSTPPEGRIHRFVVPENTARELLISKPDMDWPPGAHGPTTGKMAVYISVDRDGRVREVWPEGSDNAELEGWVRDQVRKWQFKGAKINGIPTQIESLITFTFRTKVASNH